MAEDKLSQIPNLDDLVTIFSEIPDFRKNRRKRHELVDILVIALCATICGIRSFEGVVDFGKERRDFLSGFLLLPNGIPSHDTFRRVLMLLSPPVFLTAVIRWTRTVREAAAGEVVALDGKAMRGARDAGDQAGVMVGAWSVGAGISLGQIKVDGKSNEIAALPELLELLDLEGCIVTIDAMGCQKAVAAKIREQKADYVLALKGNQGSLFERSQEYLDTLIALGGEGTDQSGSEGHGHGRTEVRRCWACGELGGWLKDSLETYGDWKGLRSLAAVESERTLGGKTTVERRYFITSLAPDAAKIADAVRDHWGIENSLHWGLDVNFGEDASRARRGNAAENLSSLRRLAISMIRRADPGSDKSITRRMNIALMTPSYLQKILGVVLDA